MTCCFCSLILAAGVDAALSSGATGYILYVCASNDSVDGEKLIYVDPRQRDEVCACFVPGYFANESIVLVFISISIFQVSSW